MADQDKAVSDYLATIGVEFSTVLVGATKRDQWDCDQWRIKLEKRAQSGGKVADMETDYFTGVGRRKSKRPMPAYIARLGARIVARVEWEKANIRPVTPEAAGVLYSLLLDASGADGNFLDWCDAYGYDSDSRKALATYEGCCVSRAQLHKLFTTTERAELAAMLEDY